MRKILFVGSLRHLDPEERSRFEYLGRRIGQAVARSNEFEMILCSTSENTIDRYLLEGANSVQGEVSTTFVYLNEEPGNDEHFRSIGVPSEISSNLRVAFVQVSGGWRITHLRAIGAADLVVAVGGSQEGTGTVIYSAEALEKPVLIVRDFGGAAAQSWRDLAHYYDEQQRDLLSRSDPGDDEWLDRFLSLGADFCRHNPMRRSRKWENFRFVVTAAFLAVLWFVVLYWNAIPILLFAYLTTTIACSLGIALQQSISADAMARRKLGADVVQALAIGFGLLILAQGATYSVGANFSEALKTADRIDLALRLSTIGFLAGFARPMFIESLTSKASEALRSAFK